MASWNVVASEHINSSICRLLEDFDSSKTLVLSGLMKGWKDETQKTFYVHRLELHIADVEVSNLYLSSSLETLGYFFLSSSKDALFQARSSEEAICNLQNPIILNYWPRNPSKPCDLDPCDLHFQFKEADSIFNDLSVRFQSDIQMSQLLNDQNILWVTELCPRLVYVNHDHIRDPVDAIEIEATRWLEDNINPDHLAFIAKGTNSSSIISFKLNSGMTIAKLCGQSSPNSPKQAMIELQLLHNHSKSPSSSSHPLVTRYDAINISEPSLDDSTHEEFENNPPAFHVVYPRISVATNVFRSDDTETGFIKALKRHCMAISSQLIAFVFLTRNEISKLSKSKKVKKLPFYQPYHFLLNNGSSNYITTVFYKASTITSPKKKSQEHDNEEPEETILAEYRNALIISDSKSLSKKYAINLSTISVQSSLNHSISDDLLDGSQHSVSSSNLSSSTESLEVRLFDVHKHVPDPGSNYQLHLVKGSYDYYHYYQDGFDDRGWGCAYRSMQTLVSWIIKQNLSIKAVPSHTEIQRMLVEMMDKPPSFVNSKQWIGAVEISMCLSQYWDVMCKILHAPSGSKIGKFSQDLANHFDHTGAPVMVGGSVLAYTILGIAIDKQDQTNVKYLILDPHYVGPENITNIVSKGWCSWKAPNIWKEEAFYNLCLPQTRPKM